MKIYFVTYQESEEFLRSDENGDVWDEGQSTIRIKAESLEQAYDKAYWGLGRKLIDVREATAEDYRQELRERRDWMRKRARYLATLEGQLKSIGFSDAQIADIKEQAKQRRSLETKIVKLRRLMRGWNLTDDEIEPYVVELRRKLVDVELRRKLAEHFTDEDRKRMVREFRRRWAADDAAEDAAAPAGEESQSLS